MKYLVIGGSSFIGAYAIDELLARGATVVTTGRNPKFANHYERRGVEYVNLDICDKDSFGKLDCDFDGAVSLAARMPASVEKSPDDEDIIEYITTNVVGTLNILEWCRKNEIPRLVDVVSRFDCRLYGQNDIITEESPLKFSYFDDHAAYVVSNNEKLEMLRYYNERYGMKNIGLRIPSVYGVGPHGSFAKDGVLQKSGLQIFMEKASKGERIVVFGDPETPKDVLYVKDMAIAIANSLESKDGAGLYNVAYDENFSIIDLAKATAAAFASKENGISEVVSDESVMNNGGFPRMCNKRIKKELGFIPKYDDVYTMMNDYHDELERGEYADLFN